MSQLNHILLKTVKEMYNTNASVAKDLHYSRNERYIAKSLMLRCSMAQLYLNRRAKRGVK